MAPGFSLANSLRTTGCRLFSAQNRYRRRCSSSCEIRAPGSGLTDLVSLARCPACPSSPGYHCRAVPMWGRRRLLSGRSALPPAMSRVRFPSTGERRKSKYKYRRSYRLCVVDQAIRCRLFPAFDSTAPPISPAITSPDFFNKPFSTPLTFP